MKLLKKGIVLGLACMVVAGSVNCFSYAKDASPDVANEMFHFKGGIISMCERNMTASGHISSLILP